MKRLTAALCFLIVLSLTSAISKPVLVKKDKRPNVHNTTECWFEEQRLDHFTYKPEDKRWKQRYLVYEDYWKQGGKKGPIFFYGDLHACTNWMPDSGLYRVLHQYFRKADIPT